MIPKVHYPDRKDPPGVRIPRHTHSKALFCNLHSIALQSLLDSVVCIPSLAPSDHNFLFAAYFLHTCYKCNPSHPSWVGEDYKSRNSTVCHFLQPPVAFFFSVPSISLRTAFWEPSPFLEMAIFMLWNTAKLDKIFSLYQSTLNSQDCHDDLTT